MTLKPIAECWQWSCHYPFLRLKYVAAGIRTPNLPLPGQTLLATVPPLACEDDQKYNSTIDESVKGNLAKFIGYILIVSLSLEATVPPLACEDDQKYNRLETVKRNLAKSIGYILIVSLSSAVLTANRINLPSV